MGYARFSVWADGCNGKDKNKCGGLSAARWTMKLSTASVEMTLYV
jgi:hypothetical protein